MKIRNGFITNSSSTNFTAASADALLALLISLIMGCKGQGEGKEEDTDSKHLQVIVDPAVDRLKVDDLSQQINIFAKARSVDSLNVMQEDPVATSNIQFTISEEQDLWLTKTPSADLDGYKAIGFLSQSPYPDKERRQRPSAPKKIVVKISTEVHTAPGVTGVVSAKRSFLLIDLPVLRADRYKLNLVNGGEPEELFFTIENPTENSEYQFDVTVPTDFDYYLEYSKISDQPNTLKLTVTPRNLQERQLFYYESFKMTVSATDGKETINADIEAVINFEGLFLASVDGKRAAKAVTVSGKLGKDRELPKTKFELVYTKWIKETKKLEFIAGMLDNVTFSRPYSDDAPEQADIVEYVGMNFELIKSESEFSRSFTVNAEDGYPSMEGDVKCFIDAELNVDADSYFLPLPIILKPDDFDKQNDWETQYKNCLKILMYYAPPAVRDIRLAEFQSKHKSLYSVEDLKAFRAITWEISCRAYLEQANDEMVTAWWFEKFEQGATVLEAFADIAFNLCVAQISGPLGSFALQQIKGFIKDFLVKYQDTDKPFVEFSEEFCLGKIPELAGGTIDSLCFSGLDKVDKVTLAKWLVIMFAYKWAWHWYFDMEDDGKTRKGMQMAFVNATKDVSGSALEALLSKYAAKSFAECPRKDLYSKLRLQARERKALMDGKKALSGMAASAKTTASTAAKELADSAKSAADAISKNAKAASGAAGDAASEASEIIGLLSDLIREQIMGQA